MKQNYKKLIFPILALAFFLPLISMAANNETSLPEKEKKSFQFKKDFKENTRSSQFNEAKRENALNKEDRESRRLKNRTRQLEMMEILEAGDYSDWLEFVKDSNCPMKSKISEENFSQFVENYKLKIESRVNR